MDSFTSQGSSILIVDDNPKNLQVLGGVLVQEEYEVEFATNAMQALDRLEHEQFDLLLLDIMMPEIDGFELCRRTREMNGYKNVPIIFLSAKTDKEDVLEGFRLGAQDYITKPFDSRELLVRVKTQLELQFARQRLQELNATKDKFFSIIAHDLKNPFFLMEALSKILIKNIGDLKIDGVEKLIETSEGINATARNGKNLLNNLLEWAKSQSGKIPFIPVDLSFDDIVSDSFQVLQENAKAKNIALVNETKGVIVHADTNMIGVVMNNLVSNAIKFTPNGGQITVSAENVDDNTFVSVTDTGVGMTDDVVKKLFRIDEHYTTPGTADEMGTGLGLILCKEFIDNHAGDIHVESNPPNGTTFKISLPRKH